MRLRRLRAAPLLQSIGMVIACGCGSEEPPSGPGADDQGPTGDIRRYDTAAPAPPDNGNASGIYPAPHLDAPTVVTLGGPVLPHPRIVPVLFAEDGYALEIVVFLHAMIKSAYWAAATAEYGVGEATIGDPILIEDVPESPLEAEAIEAWLVAQLDAPSSRLPAPDGQTLYALFYPRGTALAGGRWGKSCADFAGYHWEATRADGSRAPYLVIPRCASWRELHGFDVVTTATSHEIIEVVTDPFPDSAPAFASLDDDHQVWQLFPYAELADMCSAGTSELRPADLDYTVQRTWSNAQARAHHDPCAMPTSATPYFNSAPLLVENVPIELVERTALTKGVKIPLGESKTIEVDLFSDGPTKGEWSVTAHDVGALGGRLPSLSFAFDRDHGVNGEKLHLTITAVRQGQSGGAELMLVSTLGGQTSTWFGFVAN